MPYLPHAAELRAEKHSIHQSRQGSFILADVLFVIQTVQAKSSHEWHE
jgi:hypothetical protein